MFTAISCFVVQPGFEDQVKEAFTNRPKLVENYPGFIRLDVLSPTENAAEISSFITVLSFILHVITPVKGYLYTILNYYYHKRDLI